MQDELTIKQIEKIARKRKKGVSPGPKGKRGETYFADQLSKITGLHFHRIYTSGAAVGQKKSVLLEELTQAQGEAQLGDIQSPEQLLYYYIFESKNYVDIDFHNLINPQKKFSKKITGWIGELEYDIESAIMKMKNNYRPVAGFLCVKVTRKGSWVIANKQYIKELLFRHNDIKFENVLFFHCEPRKRLKDAGFGTEYFMTDFNTFFQNNKMPLFLIDIEREKRLEKAKSMFKKIYHEK